MKLKSSVLLLLLLSFLSVVNAQADTLDPCADSLQSVGVLSPAYLASSTQMRVQTLCEFRDAIIENYSLFNMKKERLTALLGTPFDSLAYLNNCVTKEKNITNDDSDIHFIDRMTQYVAGFHDTHFSLQAAVPMPLVFTGINTTQIGGKYYISSITPQIFEYAGLSQGGGNASVPTGLTPGTEIISVDGQNPADLATHYSSFISGSSNDYIQEGANEAIFSRTFDYPTKNSVSVVLKDAKGNSYTLSLPWWVGVGAHNRDDASEYFQKLGIPVSDKVKLFFGGLTGQLDWTKVGLQTVGYSSDLPLFRNDPYNQLVEYKDDAKLSGLRVGEVVIQGGLSACYMQLLTFNTVNFTLNGNDTKFADTISSFISNCESKKLDLILDLRSNPGGIASYPDQLLAILSEPGKTYPAPVMALRTTQSILRLESADFKSKSSVEDTGEKGLDPVDVIKAAIARGQTETDIMPELALGADSKNGDGFSGKILALVTPDCVSSCDVMASLLKKSGRATLLGTHSNGTGAGFSSIISPALDSTFRDSNYEIATEIPNHMFGVPDQILDTSKTYSYSQYENSYLLENHPTVADIQYQTTLDDLNPQYYGRGWKKAVAQAFYNLLTAPAPKAAPAPTNPSTPVATSAPASSGAIASSSK